jgi:hypothetical protein
MLLSAGTANAQVSLSVANHVPVVGQTVGVSRGDSIISFGPAGANVPFNYWDLMYEATLPRLRFYTPATATMPGASIGSTDGGSDTTFWNLSGAGLEVVGLRGSLEGVVTYTDRILELPLPLEFGDTWTDAGTASYTAFGFPVTRLVSFTGAADAYGTLTLSDLQTVPVLRVSTRRQINDNNLVINVLRINRTTAFYSATSAHPVLRLSIDSARAGTGGWTVETQVEVIGEPITVGLNEYAAAEARFTAFPNPASGNVTVQLNSPADLVQLFDAKGAIVRSLNTTSDRVVIDLQGMEPGTYLVRAYRNGAAVETRPIVVE